MELRARNWRQLGGVSAPLPSLSGQFDPGGCSNSEPQYILRSMRRARHLMLIMLLLAPVEFSLISSANAAKTGSNCSKLNTKSTDGNKPLICKKNAKGKLVWMINQRVLEESKQNRLTALDSLINIRSFVADLEKTLISSQKAYFENLCKGGAFLKAADIWKTSIERLERSIEKAITSADLVLLNYPDLKSYAPSQVTKTVFGKCPTPALQKISTDDFRRSLAKMTVSVDEFKGNYEIFPRNEFRDLVKQDSYLFGVTPSITKADEKSEWIFALTSSYRGNDWLFHYEINLKSDTRTLNLPRVILISKDILGGGRGVDEFGVYQMSNKEADDFCTLIAGESIKFRLLGSSGVNSLTGTMSVKSLDSSRAICQVFSGLKQGFKP